VAQVTRTMPLGAGTGPRNEFVQFSTVVLPVTFAVSMWRDISLICVVCFSIYVYFTIHNQVSNLDPC
jgi:hypothetical protein